MAFDQESLILLQKALTAEAASWRAGRNSLFGLGNEQLRRRLGYTPGPGEPSLEERERRSLLNLKQHAQPRTGAVTAVDWRDIAGRNFISPVKDQGNCGSCVSFGVAATLDARIRVIRNLACNDEYGFILHDLSEAQLFYCGNPGSDSCYYGWYPINAFDYCQTNGLAPEYCFPYSPGNQPCGVSANWISMATTVKEYSTFTDVNLMKAWLTSQGPLATVFNVYSDFYAYVGGVYRRSRGAVEEAGHCVSVVGFADILQAWLCKNSWGTQWGDKGFFWIGYGECGIDSQMWLADSFEKIFPEPGSVCTIESFMVGLVLDSGGGDTAPGSIVVSNPQDVTFSQLWVFTAAGHILNIGSGLVLSIVGGSSQPGESIEMAVEVVPPVWYQQWTLTADGHISSTGTNLVLDIPGAIWDPDTPIRTWTKDVPSANNQRWRLSYLRAGAEILPSDVTTAW